MSDPSPPLRRAVAIVGRPNVGKSALFNRLVGRRLAIVHEESGVTRDRLIAEAHWHEQHFEVIDTGGLSIMDKAARGDVITAGIARQVEVAIADAPVALLAVDAMEGLQAMDQEVATRLRQSDRTVFVAVNKSDNEELDARAAEFAVLGFPVFSVSALHNRGTEALLKAVTGALPEQEDPSAATPLKVAIVGRPNVGKSSFINRLLRDDRVMVSSVPGTTRDSVEIPFMVGSGPQARHYMLIDTAGMRRKGKIKDQVERFSLMRTERSMSKVDIVALIVDATAGPTAHDKNIAAKVLELRKGIVLIVNKWDLAEGKVTQRAYNKGLAEAVPFLGFAPIVYISASTGYNIRQSIEVIDQVAANVNQTVGTGLLNRILRDAFEKTQPPLVGGRRLKMYYATQVGTRPVRIRLFVNGHNLITPAYRQYLLRRLREKIGLDGAPIILQFEGREERKPKP